MNEGPQALGGLELGRVRRKVKQVDPLGSFEVVGQVPARSVDDEDDVLVGASTDGACEVLEREAERDRRHRGHHEPVRVAGGRAHEAVEVEPLVPGPLPGHWAASPPGPDPTHDGLEPKASLVLGPDLYAGRREATTKPPDFGCERFFLKEDWALASAPVCRGRGTWRLKPSR
jgi:hypothetical protein